MTGYALSWGKALSVFGRSRDGKLANLSRDAFEEGCRLTRPAMPTQGDAALRSRRFTREGLSARRQARLRGATIQEVF